MTILTENYTNLFMQFMYRCTGVGMQHGVLLGIPGFPPGMPYGFVRIFFFFSFFFLFFFYSSAAKVSG